MTRTGTEIASPSERLPSKSPGLGYHARPDPDQTGAKERPLAGISATRIKSVTGSHEHRGTRLNDPAPHQPGKGATRRAGRPMPAPSNPVPTLRLAAGQKAPIRSRQTSWMRCAVSM